MFIKTRSGRNTHKDPVVDLHELYLALGTTPEERQKIYREMAGAYMLEKGLQRQPALTSGVIIGRKTFVEMLLEEYAKIVDYFKTQKAHAQEDGSYALRRLFP